MKQKMTGSVDVIKLIIESLRNKEETLEDEINDRFDQLAAIIEERRACLLNQLHSRVSSTCEKLDSQRKDLEDNCMNASKPGGASDTIIDNCSEPSKAEICGETGDLRSKCKAAIPVETDYLDLAWDTLDDLKELCCSVGEIVSSSCIPSQSSAVGEGLRKAIVGKQSLVTLTTRDCSGDLTPGPSLSQITCQIESVGGVEPGSLPRLIQLQVIFVKCGEYDVVYTLPKEGRYRMWIRIYGKDVQDSPYQITCLPPPDIRRAVRSCSASLPRQKDGVRVRSRRSTPGGRPLSAHSCNSFGSGKKLSWNSSGSGKNPVDDDLILVIGSRGRGKGEFTNPQGVAVTSNNEILVCDSNSQCVQVFNTSGAVLGRWGVRGRLPGQLQRPTGIAVMKDGSIAVSDYDNRWVSVFEAGGKYKYKTGGNKLLGPKGLAVSGTGDLVVVDNKASCVHIVQPMGKAISKFGSRGSGTAQFAGPHYAAVNSHNNIIISDFHNHNIKVFTEEGHFIFSFGCNGEGNGQFNAPTGVAVDSQDNILVADWGNSRIQVFDQYGSFLSYVNTSGCKLYGPQGLALTSDGHIVVADSGNHCVKMYRYLQ